MHALSFASVDFWFCVFHAHIADCGAEIYFSLASYYTVKLAILLCSTCIRFAKITGSQTAHTRSTWLKSIYSESSARLLFLVNGNNGKPQQNQVHSLQNRNQQFLELVANNYNPYYWFKVFCLNLFIA